MKAVTYSDSARMLMDAEKHMFDCHATAVEIYCERLRDLLVPLPKASEIPKTDHRPLVLREDPQRGVLVSGLSEKRVNSAEELLLLFRGALLRRRMRETSKNTTSSRAHTVLSLHMRTTIKTGESVLERRSSLHLMDLAGAERQTPPPQDLPSSVPASSLWLSYAAVNEKRKQEKTLMEEACFINKSLSTLVAVVAEAANRGGDAEGLAPPFSASVSSSLEPSLSPAASAPASSAPRRSSPPSLSSPSVPVAVSVPCSSSVDRDSLSCTSGAASKRSPTARGDAWLPSRSVPATRLDAQRRASQPHHAQPARLLLRARDSKLTFLLKNALDGKARVTLMATVSPLAADFSASLSTLQLAQKARQIRGRPPAPQQHTPPRTSCTTSALLEQEILRLRALLSQFQHAPQAVRFPQLPPSACAPAPPSPLVSSSASSPGLVSTLCSDATVQLRRPFAFPSFSSSSFVSAPPPPLASPSSTSLFSSRVSSSASASCLLHSQTRGNVASAISARSPSSFSSTPLLPPASLMSPSLVHLHAVPASHATRTLPAERSEGDFCVEPKCGVESLAHAAKAARDIAAVDAEGRRSEGRASSLEKRDITVREIMESSEEERRKTQAGTGTKLEHNSEGENEACDRVVRKRTQGRRREGDGEPDTRTRVGESTEDNNMKVKPTQKAILLNASALDSRRHDANYGRTATRERTQGNVKAKVEENSTPSLPPQNYALSSAQARPDCAHSSVEGHRKATHFIYLSFLTRAVRLERQLHAVRRDRDRLLKRIRLLQKDRRGRRTAFSPSAVNQLPVSADLEIRMETSERPQKPTGADSEDATAAYCEVRKKRSLPDNQGVHEAENGEERNAEEEAEAANVQRAQKDTRGDAIEETTEDGGTRREERDTGAPPQQLAARGRGTAKGESEEEENAETGSRAQGEDNGTSELEPYATVRPFEKVTRDSRRETFDDAESSIVEWTEYCDREEGQRSFTPLSADTRRQSGRPSDTPIGKGETKRYLALRSKMGAICPMDRHTPLAQEWRQKEARSRVSVSLRSASLAPALPLRPSFASACASFLASSESQRPQSPADELAQGMTGAHAKACAAQASDGARREDLCRSGDGDRSSGFSASLVLPSTCRTGRRAATLCPPQALEAKANPDAECDKENELRFSG
ncbi:hypothetical protein BESB_078770 [Besnoitia besnoiti]|uniref:Kinesin motor domain-containing protein n=1 Tax=Besnoitia besnoiti TaxID=94643 RepID=A0A2A9MBH2_BESBE|nr:hypothetical protein BESB_078770 [Besnoitia besnoiti]PFH33661.1 hypothetical protein BESB_078770 [Besnoitia besnoiti]